MKSQQLAYCKANSQETQSLYQCVQTSQQTEFSLSLNPWLSGIFSKQHMHHCKH